MKNVVIGILVCTTLAGGYIVATSKLRISNVGIEGKLEKIARGDLSIPINATGEVKPAKRVEVKAEASGEVIAILKQAGERARTGRGGEPEDAGGGGVEAQGAPQRAAAVGGRWGGGIGPRRHGSSLGSVLSGRTLRRGR